MESGTIVKWLKSEGERVEKGEPLYELDTDKVTQEVEADASGVLLRIAVPEGEGPVGRTIALIGEEREEGRAPREGRGGGGGARFQDRGRGAAPQGSRERRADGRGTCAGARARGARRK